MATFGSVQSSPQGLFKMLHALTMSFSYKKKKKVANKVSMSKLVATVTEIQTPKDANTSTSQSHYLMIRKFKLKATIKPKYTNMHLYYFPIFT